MPITIPTSEDFARLLSEIQQMRKELNQIKETQSGLSTDFTLKQAAQKIGMSPQFVTDCAKLYKQKPEARKALAYYKAGKQYRFTPEAIRDWKERNSFNHQLA